MSYVYVSCLLMSIGGDFSYRSINYYLFAYLLWCIYFQVLHSQPPTLVYYMSSSFFVPRPPPSGLENQGSPLRVTAIPSFSSYPCHTWTGPKSPKTHGLSTRSEGQGGVCMVLTPWHLPWLPVPSPFQPPSLPLSLSPFSFSFWE